MGPLALARDQWFRSEEGVRCVAGAAWPEELRNCLKLAFSAGAKAQARLDTDKVTRHVERTIRQLQGE